MSAAASFMLFISSVIEVAFMHLSNAIHTLIFIFFDVIFKITIKF
jgi:hypothetical protein